MSNIFSEECKISVKVIPNAHKNEVLGMANGQWRFKISAPPDKGKANRELIEFLSDILKIKKDQINIIKGQTSHRKIIEISGLKMDDATRQLHSKL